MLWEGSKRALVLIDHVVNVAVVNVSVPKMTSVPRYKYMYTMY